jgi:hypothetical protein
MSIRALREIRPLRAKEKPRLPVIAFLLLAVLGCARIRSLGADGHLSISLLQLGLFEGRIVFFALTD